MSLTVECLGSMIFSCQTCLFFWGNSPAFRSFWVGNTIPDTQHDFLHILHVRLCDTVRILDACPKRWSALEYLEGKGLVLHYMEISLGALLKRALGAWWGSFSVTPYLCCCSYYVCRSEGEGREKKIYLNFRLVSRVKFRHGDML